jgi:2-methylcitrate dehydratase PrpD
MGPTERLARFVAGFRYADLGPAVRERAKACVLDWIGCALAGIGSPTDRALQAVLRAVGGRGPASLIGAGRSASSLDAALYNGALSAVGEIDDVHELVSLHPATGILPAALATAEQVGASGQRFLAAVVAGYDVAVRVACAAGESHYRFWHSTATCTTFGAAAAAGKLLGLDAAGLATALGLAGTQAAGLWESINTSAVAAKHLHSGKAAASGVLAAWLARHGLAGSHTILEGAQGFLAAMSQAGPEARAGLTADLGRPFLISRNFFKRHACCKACIDGIDGILALMRRHDLRPQDVRTVTATLRAENARLVGNPEPGDPYAAKFSLPFCMALAALTGTAGPHQFTRQALRDRRVRAWMRKVEVRGGPAPAPRARLEVDCGERGRFSVEPAIRSLTPPEVREKFHEVVAALLTPARAAAIQDAVERLDRLPDLTLLTSLIRRRVAWRTRGGR